MIPTVVIEKVPSPNGGTMVLSRRGNDYVIRVDGIELMGSRNHGSEDELGRVSCSGIKMNAPRVLIGGLGLGFTLRAALDVLPTSALIDLVELMGDVIRWNRTQLGHLANYPLNDPRVTVVHDDVAHVLQRATGVYDVIVLDVDNGPDALTQNSNVALYRLKGLQMIYSALRVGGTLAVWSAFPSKTFTAWLAKAGFAVRCETFKPPGAGTRHYIWFAIRN
jgi:spermidine synthase